MTPEHTADHNPGPDNQHRAVTVTVGSESHPTAVLKSGSTPPSKVCNDIVVIAVMMSSCALDRYVHLTCTPLHMTCFTRPSPTLVPHVHTCIYSTTSDRCWGEKAWVWGSLLGLVHCSTYTYMYLQDHVPGLSPSEYHKHQMLG